MIRHSENGRQGQLWVAAEGVVAKRRGGDTGGAGGVPPLRAKPGKKLAREARPLIQTCTNPW
jgi:hypothetical protein